MRALLVAVMVASQALPPSGVLDVQVRGGLITLHAHGVPLSRILDRLAQQTGMKVTYEGGHPSQPVSATLEDLPPREVIVRLMEGLGLSYVFRTDVTGEQVEALIVSAAGSGGSSSQATSARPPDHAMEFPSEVIDEQGEYEEPPAVEMPQMVPGQPVPDLALPSHMGGTVPGFPMPPGTAPQPPPGQPEPPRFPQPISNPF